MSLERIIIHWTAGSYTNLELDHYHFVVDKDGEVHTGKKPPESNSRPLPWNYVPHCGGGNTGSIGISMAGMAGFKHSKDVGKYPLTQKQCESCWKKCAALAKKYNIPLTEDGIMTHYVFGKRNPKTSSAGKIDIVCLPHEPNLKADEINPYILNKVKWYASKF